MLGNFGNKLQVKTNGPLLYEMFCLQCKIT